MQAPNLVQVYAPPLGADVLLPLYSFGRHSVEAVTAAAGVDECHFASRVGSQDWIASNAEGTFAARAASSSWKDGASGDGFANRNSAGDWRTEKEC